MVTLAKHDDMLQRALLQVLYLIAQLEVFQPQIAHCPLSVVGSALDGADWREIRNIVRHHLLHHA
jgi:hypothetical protein